MQATRQYEDFPILLETYRSCLYDVFDMNALEKVISNIQDKKVQIHHVQTPYPSPMASGLIFNFITYQMYDYDRSRAPADAASISSEVLSQIISREEIPAIIDPETIGKAEQRWQFLLPENKARDAEELFLIIQKLEPISQEDLSARCIGDLESHLEKLREDKRIFKNQKGENHWITAEYVKISESSPKYEIIYHQVNNYTEVHGPVLPDEISTDLHLPVDLVIEALKKLTDKKVLIYGQMVKNRDEFFWCNKYNFAELYRQAISIRRKKTTALNRTDLYKFLFKWHIENKNVTDILYQYQFLPFDTQLFERELLRARKCTDSVSNLPVIRDEISMELINGNYILRYAPGTTKIFFHRRGEGGFVIPEQSDEPLDENENSILDFLHENGASIISDLEEGLDKDRYQLTTELRSLAMKGRITCDNYHVMVFPEKTAVKRDKNSIRRQVYSRVKQNADIESTRWFHISAFSVLGKKRAITDQAEFQARMLLQRYGILVKEWYRRESGLLPWIDIFQALKRLEWQGEIRRGYFVSDLSGIQFASHQAVELLENMDHVEENYHLLSVLDPALPFGPRFTWNLQTLSGQEVNVTRSPVNHILFLSTKPIAYLENFAEKIWLMEAYNSESAGQIAQAIKIWLMMPEGLRPKRKIEIKKINGDPAIDSPLTKVFLRLGFESDQKKLVLWPSGV